MEENRNSFIKRLLEFSVGPVISAIIGFFMTPITTWLVIPEEFGKASMYTMALSLTSLFLYLGIDQAFIREYSVEENKRNLFWNSFLTSFSFSVFIVFVYIILGKPISYILFNSDEKFIIYILALALPFSIIQRFNMILIRMQEKAKLYSFFIILDKIINLLILLVLLLTYEKSFISIILAQFFSLIIINIIFFIINKDYWFYKYKINKPIILKLLKYGIPLVPATIFSWLLNSMDKMALRTWSNFYELGIYSAALKIVTVLDIVKTSFSTFWTPTAYRWYETGIPNEKFEKVSKILSTCLFILFGLLIFLKDYIVLIFDKSYKNAAEIVPFLLFLPIMYTITETTKLGINFTRNTFYNILNTGLAGLVNAIGNYILVPIWGGVGASISTGISYIVYFWISTLVSRKLWFKFDLYFYAVNIIFIFSLASVSVFFDNKLIETIIS